MSNVSVVGYYQQKSNRYINSEFLPLGMAMPIDWLSVLIWSRLIYLEKDNK